MLAAAAMVSGFALQCSEAPQIVRAANRVVLVEVFTETD